MKNCLQGFYTMNCATWNRRTSVLAYAFWKVLDLWTCNKPFIGLENPCKKITIDDVIPV